MNRSLLWSTGIAALAVLLLHGAAVASEESTERKDAPEGIQLIAVGADPVPFQLKDLTGKDVALQDLLGKNAVVLTFWSLFCGPCQEELPQLEELHKKYAAKGLSVLTVNLDGPRRAKAVEKYMADKAFTFPVLWEIIDGTSYVTADKYGVMGTPTLVLIDRKGKVSYTHAGLSEMSKLEQLVESALAN